MTATLFTAKDFLNFDTEFIEVLNFSLVRHNYNHDLI